MAESTSSTSSGLKFKIAYGSDIRRIKQPLMNMADLKNTCLKIHKPNCEENALKYFYYDSDDDRIDVSDDEDFTSAVLNCHKSSLKFHVEKYDPNEDSFFQSKRVCENKLESKTGASTNSSLNKDEKVKGIFQSVQSVEESIEESIEENLEEFKEEEEYPVFLRSIKDAESGSD